MSEQVDDESCNLYENFKIELDQRSLKSFYLDLDLDFDQPNATK